MQELTFILLIINILKGIIDLYKFIDEKIKNAKSCNSKRK